MFFVACILALIAQLSYAQVIEQPVPQNPIKYTVMGYYITSGGYRYGEGKALVCHKVSSPYYDSSGCDISDLLYAKVIFQ